MQTGFKTMKMSRECKQVSIRKNVYSRKTVLSYGTTKTLHTSSRVRDTLLTKFANVSCATPRSRDLPEKLTRPQPLTKFPAFYRTWRFIAAFTTARQLFLSPAR